jgi:GT2 family glycosyltransferase
MEGRTRANVRSAGTRRHRTATDGPIDRSVVICAYTERRWADLQRAVGSVSRQTLPAREIVVVVDHDDALLARARSAWPASVVIPNRGRRGLSGARNTGVAAASGDAVAFIDDDAVAEERWLERLAGGYADPGVIAVGGAIDPQWPRGRPRWFPAEFDWVVGCTHAGMPATPAPVRNLVGANMSMRRQALLELGGFRDGIGRIGTTPVGCEETELCIRARQRWLDATVLYLPEARVRHRVTPERTELRYFLSRCHAEGRSKALVSSMVGRDDGLGAERTYVRRTLPLGIARALRDARRGGLGRCLAIVAGLAVTTAGYVAGPAGRRGARAGE